MQKDSISMLQIENIQVDESNPRHTQSGHKLHELKDSILQKGVLQPILVRPRENGKYEVVFGHRRLLAAGMAKLTTIPAMVREMRDQEVLEAQLIENCNREDIHPLEEAEGYRQLMKLSGYSAEDLAIKVGKSKGYVYARLKLSELPEEAKKAFYKEKLNPSTALLIARIPDRKLAVQAMKEITGTGVDWNDTPMSYRDALDHIRRNYMLHLKSAPFSTKDAELYPQAGACTVCPKRTGNQKELFGDIKSADVCSDPVCFAKKKELHQEKQIAEAKATGQTVLSEKETKQIFPYQSSRVESRSGFLDLYDSCMEDPNYRTWKKLLGKNAPPSVLAMDPNGQLRHLIRAEDAKKALKAAGHNFQVRSDGVGSAALRKARREAKIYNLACEGIVEQLTNKLDVLTGDLPDEAWKILAQIQFHYSWFDIQRKVASRRLAQEKGNSSQKIDKLRNQIKSMGGREARGLVVELLIQKSLLSYNYRHGKFEKWSMELCKQFRIDPAKVMAEVKAEIAAKSKKSKQKKD